MSDYQSPFQQIYIGNVTLKANIYERKEKKFKGDFTTELNKIFQKIANSGTYQIGQRNKLKASDEFNFFFNLCTNNIFYLIVCSKDYAEYEAYRFIDYIHEKEIYSNLNLDNRLNQRGNELMETAISEFSANSSSQIMSDINKDIMEVKSTMKNNLKEVLKSTDDARSLEAQSNNIKLGALEYESNAKELKKETCWQNFKWTLILASIVIIIGLVIFLILFN